MTRTTKRRLPRFRRIPAAVGAIELTSRDKKIIQQIAVFRFLRSTHIFRLIEGGRIQILRRLKALYHHGWLSRPRSQLDFYQRRGSQPIVYGLSSKGALLAKQELGILKGWKRWRGEKSTVGRLFLDHTLMIADILIGVESACWEADRGVVFTAPHTLEAESALKDGFHWSAWLDGIPAGLVPDAVFALEAVSAAGKRERMVCFLEADRGTMPIRRTDRRQTSVERKLAVYAALWKDGTFRRQFGTSRFAVFLVTPGGKRTESLREAVSALPAGSGLFSCHSLEEVARNPALILERCAGKDTRR